MTVPKHLGPYEVIATLGSGGMGEVYKARDTRLNRIVAVKTLVPATSTRTCFTACDDYLPGDD